MDMDDKLNSLRPTEIPEGRAIVFKEMVRQLDKGVKTLSQAAEVLIDVGFSQADADFMLAVYVDERKKRPAENDRGEKCRRAGSLRVPRLMAPPLQGPQPFSIKRVTKRRR